MQEAWHRWHALKIIAQLPTDQNDARYVLKAALELVDCVEPRGVVIRFPRILQPSANENVRRRKKLAAVSVVILSLLVGGLAVLVPDNEATASRHPFVRNGTSRFVVDTVSQDKPLTVVSTTRYLKSCSWQAQRMFFDLESGKEVARSRVNLPPIAASNEFTTRTVSIALPAGIKPGRYILRAGLQGTCAGEDVSIPDVFEQNFTVIPSMENAAP